VLFYKIGEANRRSQAAGDISSIRIDRIADHIAWAMAGGPSWAVDGRVVRGGHSRVCVTCRAARERERARPVVGAALEADADAALLSPTALSCREVLRARRAYGV
jgi:hypothetical protein